MCSCGEQNKFRAIYGPFTNKKAADKQGSSAALTRRRLRSFLTYRTRLITNGTHFGGGQSQLTSTIITGQQLPSGHVLPVPGFDALTVYVPGFVASYVLAVPLCTTVAVAEPGAVYDHS